MLSAIRPADDPAHPAFDPAAVPIEHTHCCIVGAGPAGAVLALLLARHGIPVLLLEEHHDFARDFRGDTIHPAILQIMAEMGLVDRLLQLPHTEMHRAAVPLADGTVFELDFHRLKTAYPFIMLLPQEHFLRFITAQAQCYPNFRLVLGARVEQLIAEEGKVRGVVYRAADGGHAVQARLTVGADGRFSRVRRLAGCAPQGTAPPMDVLWFRLPRRPSDPQDAGGRLGGGAGLILLNRADYWQVGYIIPKGHYQQIRAAGLDALRRVVAAAAPDLADRGASLTEWKQVSLLSVEASRVRRWYKPGLLLIGDAAHVMSPVGGLGINYAVQDAVVAANILGPRMKAGPLRLRDLAAIQRQRELPTRLIQTLQNVLQQQIIARVLDPAAANRPPRLLRVLRQVPLLRELMLRFMALGFVPVHIKPTAEERPEPSRTAGYS